MVDAASGQLTYIGEFENKVTIFNRQKPRGVVSDGVLIAIDSSKNYLEREQTNITESPADERKRNLEE